MNKVRVLSFLETHGFVGEENAVKQRQIYDVLRLSRREIRQAILEINQDFKIDRMVSFCNEGIYLTKSTKELEKMRQRAIKAIERNVERVRKMDFLLKEFTQLSFLEELMGVKYD